VASHPRPAADYAEAAERVRALMAKETADYNPLGRTQFMTHGQKVARAIVFIHGYTSCPEQFRRLGERFHDLGYNVLIAPLPHHGLADRLTQAQGQVTAEALAAYADEVVDIARGLGAHVTVAGLSGGGVTTAWAAQNRADVDQAVLMAPAFGFRPVSRAVTVGAINAVLVLPDAFVWWDPVLQAEASPAHGYPRYSRHALAQILRLAYATRALGRRAAPKAKRLLVVTNANDDMVDNASTARAVAEWRARGVSDLRTYEFPAELGLDHDFIEPTAPKQQVEMVYRKLIELMNG
jgi:carboxylesterase